MPRIATHSNPITRSDPSFLVRVPVDDVSPPGAWEQLWTRRLGVGEYELTCIPFFAYGMALGDVLQVDEEQGHLVTGVRRTLGNGVLRIAVLDKNDVQWVHAQLHDLLGRLEYLHEWSAPGYVAIHLEAGSDHAALFDGVRQLGDQVQSEIV